MAQVDPEPGKTSDENVKVSWKFDHIYSDITALLEGKQSEYWVSSTSADSEESTCPLPGVKNYTEIEGWLAQNGFQLIPSQEDPVTGYFVVHIDYDVFYNMGFDTPQELPYVEDIYALAYGVDYPDEPFRVKNIVGYFMKRDWIELYPESGGPVGATFRVPAQLVEFFREAIRGPLSDRYSSQTDAIAQCMWQVIREARLSYSNMILQSDESIKRV